jgi:hypothetical protein
MDACAFDQSLLVSNSNSDWWHGVFVCKGQTAKGPFFNTTNSGSTRQQILYSCLYVKLTHCAKVSRNEQGNHSDIASLVSNCMIPYKSFLSYLLLLFLGFIFIFWFIRIIVQKGVKHCFLESQAKFHHQAPTILNTIKFQTFKNSKFNIKASHTIVWTNYYCFLFQTCTFKSSS